MVEPRSSPSRAIALTLPFLLLAGLLGWLMWGGETDTTLGDSAADASSASQLGAEAARESDAVATPGERAVLDASATRAETTATEGRFVGRVVDPAGAPIAGATVYAWGWGGAPEDAADDSEPWVRWRQMLARSARDRVTTETDASGRFALAPRGSSSGLQLRILARGYVSAEHQVTRPSRELDLGDLVVRKGAVIAGRVMDRAGQPIAGARVAASNSNYGDMEDPTSAIADNPWMIGQIAATDATGAFELLHLEPGKFAVRARHTDHPGAASEIRSVAAGDVVRDLTIVLDAGDSVTGRVLGLPAKRGDLRVLVRRARSGEPMRNERSERNGEADPGASDRVAELDVDGSFSLRGLAAGQSHRVWVAQMVSPWGYGGGVVRSPVVEVMPGARGVELRYEQGVTVALQVVDGGDGQPVERLWVSTSTGRGGGRFGGYSARARTYAEGRVELSDLRVADKQTLTLVVLGVGYARFERKGIELPRTGRLDLGVVKLTRVPSVRVQVTAAGAPVARAQVTLRNADPKSNEQEEGSWWFDAWGGALSPRMAWTDAQGRCVLSGQAEGTVKLAVTHPDYAPSSSEPITLAAGGADVDVALVRGGVVDVSVVDADGKPLGGMPVAHRGPSGDVDQLQAFAHGRVRFERLTPGSHTFAIGNFDGDNDARASKVDVVDGETVALELRREPLGTLVVTVNEAGRPLAEARISVMLTANNGLPRPGRGGRTDAQGRATITDLALGQCSLRISHRSRAMGANVPATIVAGQNVLLVELSTSVLRGVVRDPSGKPVADAAVSLAAGGGGDAGPGMFMDGFFEDASRGGTKTDAEGRYELRGVEPDRPLNVSASAKGFASGQVAGVTVAQGGVTEAVDVTLSVAGRAVANFEVMPQRARVTLTCLDAAGETRHRRVDGPRLEFADLRPGRWRAVLHVGNESRPPVEFVVQAGATAQLRL